MRKILSAFLIVIFAISFAHAGVMHGGVFGIDAYDPEFRTETVGTSYRGNTRSGIDAAIAAGAKSIELTGNIALAAHWDLSAYTGRFSANGHQISGAFTFTAPADFVGSDNCFGSTLTFSPSRGMREKIRPEWFTAVATTDWTAAITAALVAAETAGNPGANSNQYPTASHGFTVAFSARKYSVRDKFTITKCGVAIELPAGALIEYDDANGSLTNADYLFNITGASAADPVRPFKLVGQGTIRGGTGTANNTYPRGISLSAVHEWEIDGVNINYTYQAIYATNAWGGKITGVTAKHNYLSSYFNAAVHNVDIRRSAFISTTDGYSAGGIAAGFSIRNCWGISIDTCDFESNVNGIYLYNSVRGVTIKNNYFESNTGHALYVRDESADNTTACTGIVFTGNFVNNLGSSGFGVYVRHNNYTVGQLHNLVVEGNDANINAANYFVEQSSANKLVKASSVKNNAIRSGLGEIVPSETDDNGWNADTIGVNKKIVAGTSSSTKYSTIYYDTVGNAISRIGAAFEDVVSTDAIQIAVTGSQALFWVTGVKNDNNAVSFGELVPFISTGQDAAITPIGTVTRGTPAARTYSTVGTALKLAMAADTYKISVIAIVGIPSGIPTP